MPPTDTFASHQPGLNAPAGGAFAVTPHDTNDLTTSPRALYVGNGGDVVVVMNNDTELTFKNVGSGSILPIRPAKVKATSTTATDIIGLT